MSISAVVLAAGASRRMGSAKMLLPWKNTTVIGNVVRTLLDSGVIEPVVVTGRDQMGVCKALEGLPVRWAHNADYDHTEMLQSLQIGLACVPERAEAILIALGDQPQIEGDVIREIIAEYYKPSGSIIIPSYLVRRGHPWLVQRMYWPEILALPAEASLRQFLNAHASEIHYLDVNTPTVLMDLDTPQDYEKYRKMESE